MAYVIWGFLTIYWKQLAEFDPIDLVGWRVASAALVMTVCLLLVRPRSASSARCSAIAPRCVNVVIASLLLTVNWSTYVWAVSNDHVIDTALGYFLAPLGTMAIGVFVLGERLTPMKWCVDRVRRRGDRVLVVSYGTLPWVAVLLAVTWSSYGFVKRRVALDPVTSLTAELLVIVVPALVIVAVSFGRADGIPNEAHGVEWALVLGTGVITALPLLLFAFAAQARAVHDPRPDQLPDSDHQLPARMAGVRRGRCHRAGSSGSCSCGARSCSPRSTPCAATTSGSAGGRPRIWQACHRRRRRERHTCADWWQRWRADCVVLAACGR